MLQKVWSRPSTAIEEGLLISKHTYPHMHWSFGKDEESSNISMLLSELGVKELLGGAGHFTN